MEADDNMEPVYRTVTNCRNGYWKVQRLDRMKLLFGFYWKNWVTIGQSPTLTGARALIDRDSNSQRSEQCSQSS